MKTPHKHAELIKAWADGAQIERKDDFGNWEIIKNPAWHESFDYRIKPEPKPDSVIYASAMKRGQNTSLGFREGSEQDANLRLTFNGETGALKSAEVLK